MKGAAMSEPIFINHEILFNPTGNEFDECRGELLGSYQLVKIEDYEYKFIKQPQLTIPKSIADELEEEIEEAYSNDYIRSYSDVGAYMEVITDGLDEDSELYKFMFPDNDALLGCSHRNIIYLYLVDNDLVKVGEG